MKVRKIIIINLFLAMYCFDAQSLFAWNDTNTHPDITRYVIDKTIKQPLQDYLRYSLGFKDTLREAFYEKYKNGKPSGDPIPFIEIIAGGAKSEDLASRGLNHFYEPIAGTPSGGGKLHDRAVGIDVDGKHSNPVWAFGQGSCDCKSVETNPDENSNTCNDYSWIKARDAFRMALTGTTNEDRDKMFIRAFRSLGQVVHLRGTNRGRCLQNTQNLILR